MNEIQTTLKTIRPTKKQSELLGFISSFIAEHGYSPSYREIMTGLNYTSVATVSLHINSLIKRGHLVKRDHSARSLEVIAKGTQPAASDLPAGPKWLVEQVDKLFHETEADKMTDLGKLAELIGALRVLGLGSQAMYFQTRLDKLRDQLN